MVLPVLYGSPEILDTFNPLSPGQIWELWDKTLILILVELRDAFFQFGPTLIISIEKDIAKSQMKATYM